jgi:hypothetical protein
MDDLLLLLVILSAIFALWMIVPLKIWQIVFARPKILFYLGIVLFVASVCVDSNLVSKLCKSGSIGVISYFVFNKTGANWIESVANKIINKTKRR